MLGDIVLARVRTLAGAAVLGAAVSAMVIQTSPALAQSDVRSRLELLEVTLENLLEQDAEKDKVIEDLRKEIEALKAGHRGTAGKEHKDEKKADAHDHDHDHGHAHGDDHGGEAGDLYKIDVGGGTARFSGIFVDTSIAAGGSSEDGETLEQLQFGDHDPDTNGFTVRTVDVSFAGGFDPYFDAFANMAFFIDNEGETSVELEEAFLQSQADPGFIPEVRAGQFFTEFGLANPVHIHDHTWLDQPFMLSRFFGPDGLRGQGGRLAWRFGEENPFVLLGGVQNAVGETQASFLSSDEQFEELEIGGVEFVDQDVDSAEDLTYHVRASKSFSLGGGELGLGASALFGPNASGNDGRTIIGGADVAYMMPLGHGSKVTFQGEFLYRDYKVDQSNPSGADDLEDYGFYAQAAYGFGDGFMLGLRGEYGSGDGASVGNFNGREEDPFRSDRVRISPLAAWQFTPYSRVTVQYNYDDADFLQDDTAHSIWVGLDFALGAGRRAELGAGGHHHH